MLQTSLFRLLFVGMVFGATACAAPWTARAQLQDVRGEVVGTATLKQVKSGVEVSVEVTGMAPGKHGFHIHSIGKCEGPAFESAGGHFNPRKHEHGIDNPRGAHGGDLRNLDIGGDGTGKLTMTALGITIAPGESSILGKDGTALVIHADADDLRSDPAGNAGARIACGRITQAEGR